MSLNHFCPILGATDFWNANGLSIYLIFAWSIAIEQKFATWPSLINLALEREQNDNLRIQEVSFVLLNSHISCLPAAGWF